MTAFWDVALCSLVEGDRWDVAPFSLAEVDLWAWKESTYMRLHGATSQKDVISDYRLSI
jgi:hypothetical protein